MENNSKYVVRYKISVENMRHDICRPVGTEHTVNMQKISKL